MSELRSQCEEIAFMIMEAVERYGDSYLLRKNAIADLEAFSKAEQIRGMERCKQLVRYHPARAWIEDQIDAEIDKLKEEAGDEIRSSTQDRQTGRMGFG